MPYVVLDWRGCCSKRKQKYFPWCVGSCSYDWESDEQVVESLEQERQIGCLQGHHQSVQRCLVTDQKIHVVDVRCERFVGIGGVDDVQDVPTYSKLGNQEESFHAYRERVEQQHGGRIHALEYFLGC